MNRYTEIDTSKEKVFFISDTHFGHNNILRFCRRPWNTVEEMNQALVDNWNSVVGENDTVYHLGDFAFASNGAWKHLIESLNGKIHLIVGNHDISRYPGEKTFDMFESVSYQEFLKIDGQKIYLNHYPFMCYAGVWRGNDGIIYQLFGHIHTNPKKEDNLGKDFSRIETLFPTQYDVGVDFNNYKPVPWEEIKMKIETQIENNTNILYWIS